MKDKSLKYIFYTSSVLLLFVMVLTSRDAGINCDEVLHYQQSEAVYNYFATNGADTSALNTPETHLKYYGQSFDNITTILIKWFNIDDIYRFRHLVSSITGWTVILLTALFAVWLEGYKAGIIVIILYAVSPTFLGHSQNNLKDIPFALGYIASVWFALKFVVSGRKTPLYILLLLTISISIALSIRAGGLLLICYLLFFFTLFYVARYVKEKQIDWKQIRIKILLLAVVITISWALSIILWPYALQSPVRNIFESYRVMAHFPDTFRQIFEGRVEWSDFMPWYYLPKSMGITIPLTVISGLVLFSCFSLIIYKRGNKFVYASVLFTFLFPLIFVIAEKSNLYSSWRQFLFLYPVLILLSAVGILYLLNAIAKRKYKWLVILTLVILSIHPLKFMVQNHPYYYLYYNQLVGGLEGAYARYELDYYYTSQTEASEWLINYLNDQGNRNPVMVKATYSVNWMFRNHPEIETSYFRWEERSQSDWDYAIVVNRYISPYQLNNGIWPPENAIHTIYADNVPVCAVVKRRTKDDWLAYMALTEGKESEAIDYFERVLKINSRDELIFFNFAAALYNDGQYNKADSVLKEGLNINPDFEPILMYLGNIARAENRNDDALLYYEHLIEANRKYFEAYVGLSQLLVENNIFKARALLRSCLTINPRYKPAVIALADTYRKTNPDIAKKYDELASTIN